MAGQPWASIQKRLASLPVYSPMTVQPPSGFLAPATTPAWWTKAKVIGAAGPATTGPTSHCMPCSPRRRFCARAVFPRAMARVPSCS